MTKQEKIREGLIKFFTPPNTTFKGNPILKENITQIVDSLMKQLHSQGVVIKVDRELPKIAITTDSFPVPCNEICHRIEQENMVTAGYVAVEPLIKEE